MGVDERERVRHAFKPGAFHEQRQRFAACGERPVDHLGGLGDEEALLWFEPVAQLQFGEVRVRRHAFVVNRIDVDDLHDVCLPGPMGVVRMPRLTVSRKAPERA